MDRNSKEKVKQVVSNAKSIPHSIYQLVFINLVLFIGLVCRQLPLLYIAGSFALVYSLMVIASKVTHLYVVPDQIVSHNIQYRLEELRQKIESYAKGLHLSRLSSESTTTIVLFVIYLSSMLNATLQIFIIVNFAFLIVFLPRQTQGCIGVLCQSMDSALFKIKYRQ